MASRQGGGALQLAGLLLLLLQLLPFLAAGPARMPSLRDDGDSDDDFEAGWQPVPSLAENSHAQGEPAVLVEATKRSWVAELAEKADNAEEAADLIDEIRSRTSGSGLRSLKAACKAMCPKCICGVILMPSLPVAKAAGAKSKAAAIPPPPAKLKKPKPTKKTMVKAKKFQKPTEAPVKTTKKPPKTPKATVKPKPPPPPPTKESIKKAKKWLQASSLESQLPDFLLDEDSDGNAYKREVDDHDPLSQSRRMLSYFGIE